MKSTEERLKKAALGAGCLFLALGAFEMQSHAADAASQVQSRALLVTRGDYEGTEYDLTPGPQNDGVNVSRMLQNAYGGQNISITTEEKTKTKSELKKAFQTRMRMMSIIFIIPGTDSRMDSVWKWEEAVRML